MMVGDALDRLPRRREVQSVSRLVVGTIYETQSNVKNNSNKVSFRVIRR